MITREVLTDVPITQVKENPDNPRINDTAVPKVAASIKESGYISPIIIDEVAMILAGHTRYKALIYLNQTVIPLVIKVTGLTPEQKKRFIVADNKTNEFAEWDWEKLNIYTEAMLKDIGFTSVELDRILNPDDTDHKVMPDVRENVDIAAGDAFDIGRHRIVCGNSCDRGIYDKLFSGDTKQADMVFTDPPYNVNYQGSQNTLGSNTRDGIANDNMTSAQFAVFMRDFLTLMLERCPGVFYICMSSQEIGPLKTIFEQCGGHWQSNIIWKKNTFTLSRADWQNQYEPILYGWNSKTTNHFYAGFRDEGNIWEGLEKFSPELKDGKTILRLGEYHIELDGDVTGRIVNMKNKTDVWEVNKSTKNKYHPTEKPFALVKKALEASSRRGGTVLDPFGGGGSTLIVCQEIERVAYIIELEPKFVDVHLRRMHMIYPDLPILKNGVPYDVAKLV